jgi:transposase
MRVYTGIDWSENQHDVVFMNEQGASIARLTIAHTPDGFLELDKMRQKLGVGPSDCLVGLETAHNLLIDFLWAHDYTHVYVIPPSVTRSCQGRYRQSGARSDESDALLIADLLRTDRQRLQPWRPDSLLTRQLRAKVSLRLHLTRNKVRLSNRLRAVLLRYYPAAWQVFNGLDTQIALAFIQAYPTPQAAAGLTFAEFQTFARQHRYPKPKHLAACFARLQSPQPQAERDTILVYQSEASLLAAFLLHTVRTRATLDREIKDLFRQHPDYPVFDSLPGLGDFLAPALLVKFGDDRQRFPTANSVQALAGTCPVTDKSGKRRRIFFRKACDREFRHIAQQWAISSTPHSPWAYAYFSQARQRGLAKNHAYRCLANRWLAIAWKLWQTRQPYDEAYHLRQRALRSKPRS